MVAVITLASLWTIAGMVVIGATRPADHAAVALADTTPIVDALAVPAGGQPRDEQAMTPAR